MDRMQGDWILHSQALSVNKTIVITNTDMNEDLPISYWNGDSFLSDWQMLHARRFKASAQQSLSVSCHPFQIIY